MHDYRARLTITVAGLTTESQARLTNEALKHEIEELFESPIWQGEPMTTDERIGTPTRPLPEIPFPDIGLPEDVDAYLATVLTDEQRLAFYQWIGTHAVRDASDEIKYTFGESQDSDVANAAADLITLASFDFPKKLPIGHPWCDVAYHTHTHGGGRLNTCRLDSPE